MPNRFVYSYLRLLSDSYILAYQIVVVVRVQIFSPLNPLTNQRQRTAHMTPGLGIYMNAIYMYIPNGKGRKLMVSFDVIKNPSSLCVL